MSALAEFQTRFSAALLGTRMDEIEGVARQPGFQVYRNTVVKGLIDVLQANYPAVERLVGADWFQAAAKVYALQNLPREAPLALYGADFPRFLQSFEPAASLPYLSGVAQLDRWWSEAHFARDEACLEASELSLLTVTELGNLQLSLHPATRFGLLQHSAVTIWQCNRPPAVAPDSLEVDDSEEAVLITRPHGAVQTLRLAPNGLQFLQLIDSGASLNAAATQVLQTDDRADIAALLAQLLNAGALTATTAEKIQ